MSHTIPMPGQTHTDPKISCLPPPASDWPKKRCHFCHFYFFKLDLEDVGLVPQSWPQHQKTPLVSRHILGSSLAGFSITPGCLGQGKPCPGQGWWEFGCSQSPSQCWEGDLTQE